MQRLAGGQAVVLIELVNMSKGLFDLIRGVGAVSRERADRTAAYFETIAATLKSGGEAVRDSASLSEQLGQLQVVATNFQTTIAGLVPEPDAASFSRTLTECWNAKSTMNENLEVAANPEARKKAAERLLTASGQFTAMASELRVRA